ncbi:NrfD/PsrC family molybdoenzyme membrane anchor subunit [Micromonospora siamensis]|uniref:Polysulphide reductase, NrfD n=1 Tax=Micromonospora siamensis TaxID=299152 RepID=A0A1C5I7M6_9ACTN|nr:NrfD/PsrC family molybdoenzyme membrane anchor subunit [Micromonospora siamensis]SCG53846.1 Polysulphide reductase, NrfD [Micromonospora siamensis]
MTAGERTGSDVRRDGLHHVAPGRDALVGSRGGRRGGRGGEVVPPAEFRSYYGRAVIKPPIWKAHNIAGYLFLGGVAGGAALLAAGADLTGRAGMRRSARLISAGATGVSLAVLVADLGRPKRFVHMLRVIKPTSPMSIGTWLLSGFAPLVAVAALDEVSDLLPPPVAELVGRLARPSGLAATAVAPAVTTYTGTLIADTAVPVWHGAYRELPYLFGASALAAAGGLVAAASPAREAAPARLAGIAGSVAAQALDRAVHRRLGMVAEPLTEGRPGRLLRASRWCSRAGIALLGVSAVRRSRALDAAGGVALAAESALTKFAFFYAGDASAADPKYTVAPQRERAVATG